MPWFLALWLIAGSLLPAAAQSLATFNINSPGTSPLLVKNGEALSVGGAVRLSDGQSFSPMASSMAGSVFLSSLVNVGTGFDTTFDFRIVPGLFAGPGVAGFGFAFVLHNDPAGSGLLRGSIGSDLGYGGATRALAIEFDNFVDAVGDSGLMEISVHTNGLGSVGADEVFSIARTAASFDFADGALHQARVRLVAGVLQVFLDGVLQVSTAYDFSLGAVFLNGAGVSGFPLVSGANAHIGFTSSTGTDGMGTVHHQEPRIENWTFTSIAQLDPCMAGNVTPVIPGDQVDLLTINGSAGGPFRTVIAFTDVPITFGLGQPPVNPSPAVATIFGLFGVTSSSLITPSPIGNFCFPTPFHQSSPFLSIVMDTAVNSPAFPPLLPGSLTPWIFTARPGFPFPIRFTIQGAVNEDSSNPFAITLTNAVVVRVVVGPPPTIGLISPALPAPGQLVTITGTGFRLGATVTVGGVGIPLSVLSTTLASFVFPGLPGCAHPLVLTNPDGQSATGVIAPPPVILTFPMFQGPAAGGNIFVITGNFFEPGATTVSFGGTTAALTTNSSTSITGLVPPGVAATQVSVVIARPDGCFTTTTYTYL